MELKHAKPLRVLKYACTKYRRTLLQSILPLLLLSSYMVLHLYQRAESQNHVISRQELVNINSFMESAQPGNHSMLPAKSVDAKDVEIKTKPKKLPRKVVALYQISHGGLRSRALSAKMKSCFNKNCVINFLDTQAEISLYSKKADAILFQGGKLPKEPPVRHDAQQVFVFLSAESPLHLSYSRHYGRESWRDALNWTMTYRRDSDIPYPYGRIVRRARPSDGDKDYKAVFSRKVKKVAWLVSDCTTESKRDVYVEKLQQYIQVDIYGACGSFKNCSKTDEACFPTIERDYMFYLSFENSICTDYVTEKVFTWFERDIITIVRGGLTYDKILPTGTYIDTADFLSIQALGEFLNTLSQDEDSYTKYLKAKAKYHLEPGKLQHHKAFCTLCNRLHQLDNFQQSYSNMSAWWYDNKCIAHPRDLV